MFRNILVFAILFTFNSSAKIYSHQAIDSAITNQEIQQQTKAFIRDFFTAKTPNKMIQKSIQVHSNDSEPLIYESKLYALLNEVSMQNKQPFLQDFIKQMKHYRVKAFKIHDEGSVPVAVFNINAKAKGIENIWQVTDSFQLYSQWLQDDPVDLLSQLKTKLNTLSLPQWQGLKRSLGSISTTTQQQINHYIVQNQHNLRGLDKFVSRYALQTANRDLVEIGLMNLDNSNSQYLLRKLSSVFDQDFVVQQLIQAVEQHKNQAFAISMMRPYLHDAWVQDILLNYLADDKLSQSAAMVLTHAESSDVLKQMQKVFQQSTSNQVKQQVVFALKLNQSEQAKTILEKLAKDLDKDSSVNQWLRGFAGERR